MNFKKYDITIRYFFIFFIFAFYNIDSIHFDEATEHHVVCNLKIAAKNKEEVSIFNHKIHQATYEIKQLCKKMYKNSIEKNNHYPHRRDTVFFVHFNHKLNQWTLYKPSFIPYNQFVQLIKQVYGKYNLQINCYHDQNVIINNHGGNTYMTLQEFEKYKKMSDEKFEQEIQNAQTCSDDKDCQDVTTLRTFQKMKPNFFWHLQIPTTGAMPGENFDIDEQYKPLAWHYLLWDLAPKQGLGAKVAIIDTGISAFKIHDEEFAHNYKKHINITMPNILQDYGYNLVSKQGLDPIEQIAINFGHYCDQEKFNHDELMQKLPEFIIDFIKNKNSFQFEQYFIKSAKNEFLNSNQQSLNKKGRDTLKDLLYGKYGVAPYENNSFFHIVHAEAPYNEEVLLETLPAPKIAENNDPFAAGHGTFTQGVVNGQKHNNLGISGLAPQAQVVMIKAFKDNGTTNKTTLKAALERAIALKNSIVSMSLKITDEFDKVKDAPLKELIDSIDYVVAASGNDGNTKKLAYKEAYPAKFDSVAFDVGAFAYDNAQYPICGFTQKELNIGPKFVAPGSNILSAGLTPEQKEDSMFVFMSGTSIAVPVITGFLALVLAEFQDTFTKEQILKVIYKFSIKLNNDEIWQKYIKLGTPDMRSALLCLHVLQSLRQNLQSNPEFAHYSFDEHFNNLVQAIYTINYYVPSCYEQKLKKSLMHDFSGYAQAITALKKPLEKINFFTPSLNKIQSCIDFITQTILTAINKNKIEGKNIDKELLTQLQKIAFEKNLDLFAQLPKTAQNRINKALPSQMSCSAF